MSLRCRFCFRLSPLYASLGEASHMDVKNRFAVFVASAAIHLASSDVCVSGDCTSESATMVKMSRVRQIF